MAARQAVLGMEHASFYYGSKRILQDGSFLLADAPPAPVGGNRAGKSTLLKCLTGALELNAGQVIRSRGLKVGSVQQDVSARHAARPLREVLHDSLARAGLGDDYWRIDVLIDEIGADPDTLDRPFG